MNSKLYEFSAIIQEAPEGNGAYVAFPYDLRTEFSKGRVKVRATFDGEPYEGSLVNMGVKNPDGSICPILGIRKDIRQRIGKQAGDSVWVTLKEREDPWQCPACGRTFDNRNQDHFCVKLTTIDQYVASRPENVRPTLERIRAILREAAPEAKERMSWQMPTFWQGENLFHFAAFQKHIGFYPGPEALEHFSDRLSGYKASKGALQLPLDRPIDYALIAQIAAWRAGQAR